MMEHRQERRVPIHIPVRLRFRDSDPGLGLALNISQGGMFVKTSARPRRNGCVEVGMNVTTAVGERLVLIPAFFVHATESGIGLMFRELDERAAEAVAWLLRKEVRCPQTPRPIIAPPAALARRSWA